MHRFASILVSHSGSPSRSPRHNSHRQRDRIRCSRAPRSAARGTGTTSMLTSPDDVSISRAAHRLRPRAPKDLRRRQPFARG